MINKTEEKDVIVLRKPTEEYAQDIAKFYQEIIEANDKDSFAGCNGLDKADTMEKIKAWIAAVEISSKKESCPKDKVPSNVYIAVRIYDNKIVGITDLRHHINHPVLGLWGGHIGYTVRPDERGKGYGKEMLRQNLLNCKKYGIEKVMVTCDSNNTASEKIILSNGGVFEKEIEVDKSKIKRFWIEV